MPDIINFTFGPNSRPAKINVMADTRLINAYVEEQQDGKGGTRFAIYGDAGLVEFTDTGENNIRGLFKVGSSVYTVAGETLYKVSSGGGLTSVGIIAGTRSVITAVNRAEPPQCVIVADTIVYQLESDILQTFQDTDLLQGVVSVDYMDGYFLIVSETGLWQISDLDSLSIAPLDVAEADVRADVSVRGIVYEHRLWIFGNDPEKATVEIWLNTGASPFPFERDSSVIETGSLSKYSIVVFDNSLAFVDHRGRVCRLQGYTPQVISSPAVERDIRRTMTAQSTDRIETFVYFEAGHEFMQISGPDWTWVYDAVTSLWHPKESYLSDRSRMRGYLRAFDKHLVGSNNDDGKIYELSSAYHDEDGDPLIVRLRSANLPAWPGRVRWHNLQLDMEMGVGDGTSDPTDGTPDLMMRYSDDGGNHWSIERQVELGEIGEYRRRIKFNRLGLSNSQGRMFEIAVSAAVRRTVINASALIERLAS